MTETELRERLVGAVLHIDSRLSRMEAALNRIASRVGVEGVPTLTDHGIVGYGETAGRDERGSDETDSGPRR